MTLKITKASDPIEVKNITACIYSVPGTGKTTLGFTAHKPLVLDFDRGAYRAGNRSDAVVVENWSDIEGMTGEDLAPYKTVVIDTAGRALDAMANAIIARNPKMGRSGALTLQGFGELKAGFISWTRLIRSFGIDIVLIAHSDEQRRGDDTIERLDMQGGSKNEVYKVADVMGRLYLQDGKRMLNFSPTDVSFGKNPAQLPPLLVPHFSQNPQFLGEVLESVKAHLNTFSESQKKVASMLADWAACFEVLEGKDDLDRALPKVQAADPLVVDNVKRMFKHRAKALGFQYDTKSKSFEKIPPKEKAA